LRQTHGGGMSRLDVLITRIFIQLGFLVAAGALLPLLMSLFQWQGSLIWRTSSVVIAIPTALFAASYPRRRHSASGVPTPLPVWIDVGLVMAAGIVLALNATGLLFAPGPAPFALGLTTVLFVAGWAYLQALEMLLRQQQTLNAALEARSH
jgi:hypothetical protein